jgi:hypothetical protein
MEARFGFDFSKVRIHDDSRAADVNARMRSFAYTTGTHIAFGQGQYQPHSTAGRELIAHELTHVVQQRVHPSVQMEDANPLDSVLTMDWDIEFKRNRPAPSEMDATPAEVLTGGGISSLGIVMSSFQMNPNLEAELEGNASIEGPPSFNQALSIYRAQYIARRIGIGRVREVPGREHVCTPVQNGLYGCGTLHAHPEIDSADRRVHVSMFVPPARGRSDYSAATSPVPQPGPGQSQTEATEQANPNQLSESIGIGYTGHSYLTTHGSSDPAQETVLQIVLAYTRQFHGENRRGLELQAPVQLQVSLTTGQVSLAGGSQLSYVVPFANNKWQWSAFVQALVGGPLSSPSSFQFQPAVGLQIAFQPLEWLQLSAQGSGGLTLQTSGPSSFDYGGMFVIQFVQ